MADEGYANTVLGLLRKRTELMGEMQQVRERPAILANDVSSVDRVLEALGHEGELDQVPTARPRFVLFHKIELQQHLLFELRRSGLPTTSRELALGMVTREGRDKYDHRLILDVIKRVGKALATLRGRGYISGGRDEKGRYVWKASNNPQRQ